MRQLQPLSVAQFLERGLAVALHCDTYESQPDTLIPSFSGCQEIKSKACTPDTDHLLRVSHATLGFYGVLRKDGYFLDVNNGYPSSSLAEMKKNFRVRKTLFGSFRWNNPAEVVRVKRASYISAMENYSAWIMGEIPRLRLYRPTISPECPVILHGTPREHHFATLKLFGIDESMIIPIPEETDIEVEELIYGTPAYRRHIPSPSGIAFLRESSCSFSLNEAWKDSRVYLTRLGQKLRRISNEDQIHDVLEGLGFRIVRPETLSVLDQVSLFSLAETIVTPFGATLANMAFCQERTRVCVIRTKFTNEFARLATMSGTKLSVFDKISRTKAPFFARNRELHQTFHVDTKSLKEFVTCLADGHR